MDRLPQPNYNRSHYNDLDTPNLAKTSVSVTSVGDQDQRGLSCRLHFIVVVQRYAQNALLEPLSGSCQHQARSCVQAVEGDLLVAYPVIDNGGCSHVDY